MRLATLLLKLPHCRLIHSAHCTLHTVHTAHAVAEQTITKKPHEKIIAKVLIVVGTLIGLISLYVTIQGVINQVEKQSDTCSGSGNVTMA